MGIRSKMVPVTKAREMAASCIFLVVITGDDAPPPLLSNLSRQHFHWIIVILWQDIIGHGFRDMGLAQTLSLSFAAQ